MPLRADPHIIARLLTLIRQGAALSLRGELFDPITTLTLDPRTGKMEYTLLGDYFVRASPAAIITPDPLTPADQQWLLVERPDGRPFLITPLPESQRTEPILRAMAEEAGLPPDLPGHRLSAYYGQPASEAPSPEEIAALLSPAPKARRRRPSPGELIIEARFPRPFPVGLPERAIWGYSPETGVLLVFARRRTMPEEMVQTLLDMLDDARARGLSERDIWEYLSTRDGNGYDIWRSRPMPADPVAAHYWPEEKGPIPLERIMNRLAFDLAREHIPPPLEDRSAHCSGQDQARPRG